MRHKFAVNLYQKSELKIAKKPSKTLKKAQRNAQEKFKIK